MKSAIAAFAVMALIGTQALAAGTPLAPASVLAPGKPAGVQEAQHHRFPLLLTLGVAAVVAAGVIVAVENGTNANCSTCSTVVTGTAG